MYIWTMVQIYKFFAKRKSDSHKKLRFRPILSPHLLLTPLIPRDFCGGWRGFLAPTTRAMVGGFFGGTRGLAGVPRAFGGEGASAADTLLRGGWAGVWHDHNPRYGGWLLWRGAGVGAGSRAL